MEDIGAEVDELVEDTSVEEVVIGFVEEDVVERLHGIEYGTDEDPVRRLKSMTVK